MNFLAAGYIASGRLPVLDFKLKVNYLEPFIFYGKIIMEILWSYISYNFDAVFWVSCKNLKWLIGLVLSIINFDSFQISLLLLRLTFYLLCLRNRVIILQYPQQYIIILDTTVCMVFGIAVMLTCLYRRC